MKEKPDGDKPFDPFEAWRGMRDANMDAWAKFMIEGVNTEAYAKTTGAMLDSYLSASAPFREMIEKTMVRALQQLSMPSRDDVISLAQRLTNIEMLLDDLDAKLDRFEAAGADKSGADKSGKDPASARQKETPKEKREEKKEDKKEAKQP